MPLNDNSDDDFIENIRRQGANDTWPERSVKHILPELCHLGPKDRVLP